MFGVGRSYVFIHVTSGVLMLSEKGSKVTSAMASVGCVPGMDSTVDLFQEILFFLDSFRETVKDGIGGMMLLSPCLVGSPWLATPTLHLPPQLGPPCSPCSLLPRKAAIPELYLPPRVAALRSLAALSPMWPPN